MHTEYEKEHSLEERIAALLRQRGFTVTTTESCTGGLLAGRLINAAGISEVYKEGYITYSNEAKEKLLHVSHETLETYGAVSEQTAQEMVLGAAEAAGAQAALATTGIAGPDGGTPKKPAGLVYIGCHVNGVTTVERHMYAGERAQVRSMAVESALLLLEQMLLGVC
ncbi:MAG: nicotinamide-nucleotide amidohydrolase family protein [Eubacterium sp.]|nr:nicotinamide-nucleotide amidohydrolase family protein [Eubacterium sp.]MCI8919712.1 nicotinamide-nucleotide amidohydrolase family protein [Eubacterium sp.]